MSEINSKNKKADIEIKLTILKRNTKMLTINDMLNTFVYDEHYSLFTVTTYISPEPPTGIAF
jgi:hypothetical protein